MGESLFFDYECALPGGGEEFASCFDWCHRDQKKPLLAVGSSDGQLSFFHDEGERLGKEVVRRDKTTGNPIGPTCLAWGPAPMANILVTGWHDGALSVWEERDDKASMLREVSLRSGPLRVCPLRVQLQGYLAHKKLLPPGTLQ